MPADGAPRVRVRPILALEADGLAFYLATKLKPVDV